jgi:hypothetical protein
MFTRARRNIWIIIYVLIALLIGILIVHRTAPHPEHVSIKSFTVDSSQNFVVTGSGLTRAEVWIVPTGTDIHESDHKLLATLTIEKTDPNNQMWTGKIPADPVSATEVYAVGYNSLGQEVGRIALPYSGVSDIYRALWATEIK